MSTPQEAQPGPVAALGGGDSSLARQRARFDGGDPEPEPPRGGPRNARFVLAMRVLAAASALMSLLALWSVEARKQSHDLQLAAEPTARPGDRIALRALLFRDVDAPEGPTLAIADVTVRLLDDQGRQLAEVRLGATPLTTLDGGLTLPALEGDFTLEASAQLDGTALTCRRALHVHGGALPAKPRGREAGPLQHLSLGRVRALTAALPPDRLLARVVGGACVPETPCRVLVWVGAPAAALTVRGTSAATLRGAPVPAHETTGLVELSLDVSGLDAELTLEARRAGVLVAERALRLPMGLAEVALTNRESIVDAAHARFPFRAPPGRDQLTFDLFVAGRWAGVQAVASRESEPFIVPETWVRTGLLRVQARGDRLSAEGAGARVVYVREPGQADASALAEIARLVAQDPAAEDARDLDPRAARAVGGGLDLASTEPQQAAAFLLAALEEQRMPVPLAASGRPAQLRRLEHTRGLFRFGVAGALVLSAFVIALSIARRGLLAADEAQVILDQARSDTFEEGEPVGPERGHELLSARLRVLLLALAVASAFLAGALLIAAKPLWF